jgi:DNA-binding response OmpR family regulator
MKDIRILLCEDDPSLGKLLTDYLRAKGFVATVGPRRGRRPEGLPP